MHKSSQWKVRYHPEAIQPKETHISIGNALSRYSYIKLSDDEVQLLAAWIRVHRAAESYMAHGSLMEVWI